MLGERGGGNEDDEFRFVKVEIENALSEIQMEMSRGQLGRWVELGREIQTGDVDFFIISM